MAMEIKTLYEIGEEVYVLCESHIKLVTILNININLSKNASKIKYLIKAGQIRTSEYLEDKVYNTKKDAAYAWLEEQELDPRDIMQGFLSQHNTLKDI